MPIYLLLLAVDEYTRTKGLITGVIRVRLTRDMGSVKNSTSTLLAISTIKPRISTINKTTTVQNPDIPTRLEVVVGYDCLIKRL